MKTKLESRMYKGWILNPQTQMTIKGEKVMLYKAMKNKVGICGTLEHIKHEIDDIEEARKEKHESVPAKEE